ncbi:hypothetical protein M378DRAFT_167397 [Amanita muscaria Koide BX008]|uniref:Uncharacterized protein n=1 Tax=Amanita muscaria (strain Koide BX008) TaxID=946122 RepID=A0A0C2T3I4_AMAMK|nr:hypothetical protein M378DRAFT_167397 [Amanita muscaria Koide BX008]
MDCSLCHFIPPRTSAHPIPRHPLAMLQLRGCQFGYQGDQSWSKDDIEGARNATLDHGVVWSRRTVIPFIPDDTNVPSKETEQTIIPRATTISVTSRQ